MEGMVPEQNSRQKDEVVSTTIMEIVIPKQNSRQKNEVLNKCNYHRKFGTREKHQTR